MRIYGIVHQEIIEQVIVKSLVKRIEVKTVCENAVGQFFIMVQNKQGLGGGALGATIEEATENAIKEAELSHYSN